MSGSQAGEATQVTKYPLDVGAFGLSPDGRQLAVALEVYVDCADLSCTADRVAAAEKRKATGRLYDSLLFRHWDTWKDGRRSHLFVAPVDMFDKTPNAAAAIDVMKGMDADGPSKPFGGAEEFTFTPDSRGLVFTARDAGREEAWSTNLDLWVAPLDGSQKPRNLTAANKGTDVGPVFSPDGTQLAYRSMARAGYEADKLRIRVLTWNDPSRPAIDVAAAWDRSPNELVWSSNGKVLYATAQNLGQQSLFAIDVAGGKVTTLIEKGHVGAPARVKTPAADSVAVLIDHLRSPAEVHVVSTEASPGAPVARTTFNKDRVASAGFGEPEQFTFPGWNNETVHAWVVKPANFEAGKKYPVAFLIHGGPQGSFGNNFHYRWNPQTYAGAGYAAVMVDFHGSTGYGQAFTDAIRGDWGGKPLDDLQKGLDAAIAKYPWLDGNNVCALGASYGGYMINWIAGNWPDRFKCLVNHDGNLDERMAYYDTEELWFPEWEHGGTPWDNPAGLHQAQPDRPRRQVEDADARHPRRPRLPRRRHAGHVDVHGAAAQGHPEPLPLLPRREPLGAEAGQQHPLARDGARLARQVAQACIGCTSERRAVSGGRAAARSRSSDPRTVEELERASTSSVVSSSGRSTMTSWPHGTVRVSHPLAFAFA